MRTLIVALTVAAVASAAAPSYFYVDEYPNSFCLGRPEITKKEQLNVCNNITDQIVTCGVDRSKSCVRVVRYRDDQCRSPLLSFTMQCNQCMEFQLVNGTTAYGQLTGCSAVTPSTPAFLEMGCSPPSGADFSGKAHAHHQLIRSEAAAMKSGDVKSVKSARVTRGRVDEQLPVPSPRCIGGTSADGESMSPCATCTDAKKIPLVQFGCQQFGDGYSYQVLEGRECPTFVAATFYQDSKCSSAMAQETLPVGGCYGNPRPGWSTIYRCAV